MSEKRSKIRGGKIEEKSVFAFRAELQRSKEGEEKMFQGYARGEKHLRKRSRKKRVDR